MSDLEDDPLAVECHECGEPGRGLSTCKNCGEFIPMMLGLEEDDE